LQAPRKYQYLSYLWPRPVESDYGQYVATFWAEAGSQPVSYG